MICRVGISNLPRFVPFRDFNKLVMTSRSPKSKRASEI